MADLCFQIPDGRKSDTELLASCVAETIAALLTEWNPQAPEMNVYVRDCDFGDPPCGCNFISATADIVQRQQNTPAAKCVTAYDATVDVRVTRPSGGFCPDVGKTGCANTSEMDSYLMAEREHLKHALPTALNSSCADCASHVQIVQATKLCGGECGGTKLTIRFSGYKKGVLQVT